MQELATYEVRVDFKHDFEIQKIDAESIGRAEQIALARNMDAISALVVCRIDRKPAEYLAGFHRAGYGV